MSSDAMNDELSKLLTGFELVLATGNVSKFDLKHFLTKFDKNGDQFKFADLCECVFNHEYGSVLDSQVLDDAFKVPTSKPELSSFSNAIKLAAESIKQQCAPELLSSYVIFLVGLSSLQEFVRWNWTGPKDKEIKSFKFQNSLTEYENDALTYLTPHHESVYHNVKHPELLMMSDIFLQFVDADVVHTSQWWYYRCLMIRQHVLLEKSSWLYSRMEDTRKACFLHESIQSNFQANVQSNIESGLMHLYYHEIMPAKQYFSKVLELVGLDIELSGAFGTRTQFQQKAVPQLFLKLQQNNEHLCEHIEIDNAHLPKDLLLEDEVLLNRIKFIDLDKNAIEKLFPEEQLAILSYCCLVQKSNASDELLTEQVLAYLECLLCHPIIWSIQMKALIMRSKTERKRTRKIERSMKQLELLVNLLKKPEPKLKLRLFMFYSIQFPPYWVLEKECADLQMSLGCVKSALEVYKRLQLWDDIVRCYQILGENAEAECIVRQQLETKQTPTLWCILGDVTGNIEHYHTAWELSNHHSARAQRSLAYHYYKRQEYGPSVPHFKESLRINHLQPDVWFSLAFAASQIEDYALAAKSYRHVVEIDPENFEAWNNLSNSYIRLDQKLRAYHTLQEALKCNYEHNRIWENYLLVCVDVGAFEDALQAWHRLLDIKGKHEDNEVLAILVKAVTTGIMDVHVQPASRLKPKVLKLFGRLTSIIPNNGQVWKLYAELYSTDPEYQNSKDTFERVINYLQKSHNCTVQTVKWEKDVSLCETIVSDVTKLGELYCKYLSMLEGSLRSQKKSSARLMMRNVLIRVEKQLQDFHSHDAEKLEGQLKLLREAIAAIESF